LNDRIVATIAAVHSDGVTLVFPTGETGTKHYKCNTTANLAAGDRVVLSKIGGTYVVDYKVGAPNSGGGGGGGGAVTSVNGKTGAVQLTASDVSARPNTWVPTAAQVGARPDTWMPTAAQVGARPNTWVPTAAQVGARPDTWTPSASDVGAVAAEDVNETWVHLTNTDGLTNVNGGCSFDYWRNGNSVTITFSVKPSTASSLVTICTLAEGYRPVTSLQMTYGTMSFLARSDGVVKISSPSTTVNTVGVLTYTI